MSLILDALNKADRENRQPESSPSLDTEHEQPDHDDFEKSSNHKLIFSGAIVTILIAASGFWLFGGSDTNISKQGDQQRSESTFNAAENTTEKPGFSSTKASQVKNNRNDNIQQEKKVSRSEELRQRYIKAQYEEEKNRINESSAGTSLASDSSTNTSSINTSQTASDSGSEGRSESIAKAQADNSAVKNRQISGLYQKTSSSQANSSAKKAGSLQKPQSNTAGENINADEQLLADISNPQIISKQERTNDRDIEQAIREYQNSGNQQAKVSTQNIQEPVPTTANIIEAPADDTDVNDAPAIDVLVIDDTVMAYYTDIGSIRDLPFSAQQKIPSIMYTDHQYTGTRKSVEINSKKYQENSRIGSDLTIEKILQDGVIMRYKKYKFKMSAYNNWINL